MTVVSWGKGNFPPVVTYVSAVVFIAGSVLLVLAYFAVNILQDRAYRKLHDETQTPGDDPGSAHNSKTL